ncbi:MAG: PKD domain-containing protein, partial [Deltaproteobacteria bacterium]|nr:PKD domain-containing protein [Deltaproteobacteria bacterium]
MHQPGAYTMTVSVEGFFSAEEPFSVDGVTPITKNISLVPVGFVPTPTVPDRPSTGPRNTTTTTVPTTTTTVAPPPEEPVTTTTSIETSSLTVDFRAESWSGRAPLEVSFSGNCTGDIASYEWHFGDGETSAEANPSHTYAGKGTYTVRLVVLGSDGQTVTATKEKYIEVLPGCVFAAMLDKKEQQEVLRIIRDTRLNGYSGKLLRSMVGSSSEEMIGILSHNAELRNEFRTIVAKNGVLAETFAKTGKAK